MFGDYWSHLLDAVVQTVFPLKKHEALVDSGVVQGVYFAGLKHEFVEHFDEVALYMVTEQFDAPELALRAEAVEVTEEDAVSIVD